MEAILSLLRYVPAIVESRLWISVVWERKMIQFTKRRISLFTAMVICCNWERLLLLLQLIRVFIWPLAKKKILMAAINMVERIKSSRLLKMML